MRDGILGRDEFTHAIGVGASRLWMRGYGDALLNAVDSIGRESKRDNGDGFALAGLLRDVVNSRRANLNPFSGYLEAPEVIIRYWSEFRDELDELEETRREVIESMLYSVAEEFFDTLPPITWAQLHASGVPVEVPDQPDDDY
jgi:hypothetical protein